MTTKNEAPKADPAAWADEVCGLIDQLDRGILARLHELAKGAPAGAGALPALRRVLAAMHAPASTVAAAPLEAAGPFEWGHRMGEGRRGQYGDAGRALVGALLARANEALDAGENDPSDPVLRLKDFPKTGRTETGLVVGFAKEMSPAARVALAGVEPLPQYTDGPGYYVLGREGATFYRAADVARLTGDAHRKRAEERAESERVERHEAERRRREWEQSPEGQRAKIRELEAKLAALAPPPAS